MQVQGTTNTGTEVQVSQEKSDAELIASLTTAFSNAEDDARRFIFSTAKLAAAIMDIHEAEVWKRVVDEETGQTFTSAVAYYKAIGGRFPLLHKLLREELVEELYSANPDAIGVNQLAALVHVDPAQITRSRQKVLAAAAAEAEAKQKAEAEAAAIEAANAAAAEAAAEAAAAGKSEAEAEAAAAAVLAFAAAEAKKAEAAAAAATRKAEAEAEKKATDKAVKGALGTLKTGIEKAGDQRHLMTPEQRAEALKLAQEAVKSWQAFDKLLASAEAGAEAEAKQPKPGNRRKAATA